ncbi:MAG: MFS transporter [Spirochaetaceae bacterium]|nr:MFS transporter [Spirochaetaceae bacterium]HPG26004.1 MFS transporter [Myxococcota bacterium]
MPSDRLPRPGYTLFVLSLVMMLNVIDRQMLAILIEPIKRDLDVSDAAMGLLTGTSFALLHVVAMIPIASLADRHSRRSLIAWGLGVWSALTVLTGLARSFGEMFWIRLGLGVGEATAVPASHSLVSDLYPSARRATALSMLVLAGPIGQMIAYAGGGWIAELWGWRTAFWLFGLPGIALALTIRLSFVEPERGAADGTGGRWTALPLTAALRMLLRLAPFRHLALAGALAAVANYALLIWSAPLWMRAFDLGSGEVGTTLALATGPANAAGILLAGRLADRQSARDVRWLVWIPAIACAAALGPAIGFATARTHASSVAFLAVASFLGAMVIGPVFTAVQGIAPPNARSMAAATISLLVTAFGLGIAPPLVGWAADLGAASRAGDSLRPALVGAVLCFGWAAGHLVLAGRAMEARSR